MLKQLSIDTIFKVLEWMTIEETELLIQSLSELRKGANVDNKKLLDELIIICYQRIYRGKFTVYSNENSGGTTRFDKSVTIDEFSHSLHNTSTIEDKTFKSTRCNCMEFVFIRLQSDYTKFVKDLNTFSKMVDKTREKDNKEAEYFDSILQYGIYIDGNCIWIEPTTSFLVSVLKVLISISNLSTTFCDNLTKLTIKSTDIGHYYIHQWSQLFLRFKNLTSLDLSDNLIRLDDTFGEVEDILGTHFEWPPQLKHLNLNHNFLCYMTKRFISKLPDTLEELLIENNCVTEIAGADDECFDLNSILPSLHTLSLEDNNRLTYINPQIFESSRGKLKILDLKGCNLSDPNIADIAKLTKQIGVTITI